MENIGIKISDTYKFVDIYFKSNFKKLHIDFENILSFMGFFYFFV